MGVLVNNFTPKTYCSFRKGQVVARSYKRDEAGNLVKDEAGNNILNEIQANAVEGELTNVAIRTATINGQPMEFVDITLHDAKDGDFIVSMAKEDSTTEQVVMALASATAFKGHIVKLTPWTRQADNGKIYPQVSVRLDGEKLPWIVAPADRPAFNQITINGRIQTDRTDRINFTMGYLAKVQEVVKAGAVAPADDIPEDIPGDDIPGDEMPM